MRVLFSHEGNVAAQAWSHGQIPAIGLTRLGHTTWQSAFTVHPSHGDMRMRGLDDKGSLTEIPDVIVMRNMDQDLTRQITAAREARQLVYIDLDDDHWNLPEWSVAYWWQKRSGKFLHPHSEQALGRAQRSTDLDYLEANMRAATGVLVTTPALLKSVLDAVPEGLGKAHICRNGIDPLLYRWPKKEHSPLRVRWMGTTGGNNHLGFLDIVPPLKAALSGTDTEFWHLGAMTGEPPLKEQLGDDFPVPVHEEPWVPTRELPALLAEVDVGIIARRPHLFHEAQSNVSGLAYMAAGVPFIVSLTGPYSQLPAVHVAGRSGPEVWERVIRALVTDADRRRDMRWEGREQAMDWTPEIVATDYERVFEADA